MFAHITGSHAYGTPTEKSDVDLVVLMDLDTEFRLRELLGCVGQVPIRAGQLNIIAVNSVEAYAAWLISTMQLTTGRDEATEVSGGRDPFKRQVSPGYDKTAAGAHLDSLFESIGQPRVKEQWDSGNPYETPTDINYGIF